MNKYDAGFDNENATTLPAGGAANYPRRKHPANDPNTIESFEYAKISDRAASTNELLQSRMQQLVDALNERLFFPYAKTKDGVRVGHVPEFILITKAFGNHMGSAAESSWVNRNMTKIAEVTINIAPHYKEGLVGLAQTLCHEMCHVVQFDLEEMTGAKNKTPGYHGVQFRELMRSIGLQTSSTGDSKGNSLGIKMLDYPIEGGPFERVINEILNEGFELPAIPNISEDHWTSAENPASTHTTTANGGAKKKTGYKCPSCDAKAWAKSGLRLACIPCDKELVVVV